MSGAAFSAEEKAAFWAIQRRGANFFNEVETAQRFLDAKQAGIEVVRLVYSKWKADRPGFKDGDFLIGSLDEYVGIVDTDFAQLKQILDAAEAAGIKIVLSTLNLPGSRWLQQNGDKLDLRIYSDFRFHEQSARFWRDLAARLKDHPAIVGFNLINEPHPERATIKFTDWYSGNYDEWYAKVKGTPADLNLLYQNIVKAIREVDAETPVVLDSGFFATPWAFRYLQPLADPRTIYSFHMYEPYQLTNHQSQGKFTYPGPATIGEGDEAPSVEWDRKALSDFFRPVREWQQRWGIGYSQIFAAEFGIYRLNSGADRYMSDLISIFQGERWHWAFYSFREDTWKGMNYELGPRTIWDAISAGLLAPKPRL